MDQTKLFVGNLSFQTTDEDLKAEFSKAGSVTSATVIKDKYSGKSRGFGFVEFGSAEDAQKAIDMFNGQDLQGRTIVVNHARPRTENGPRRDDRS